MDVLSDGNPRYLPPGGRHALSKVLESLDERYEHVAKENREGLPRSLACSLSIIMPLVAILGWCNSHTFCSRIPDHGTARYFKVDMSRVVIFESFSSLCVLSWRKLAASCSSQTIVLSRVALGKAIPRQDMLLELPMCSSRARRRSHRWR
jgi:hypothetical protein